jgi:hypothetical protein
MAIVKYRFAMMHYQCSQNAREANIESRKTVNLNDNVDFDVHME